MGKNFFVRTASFIAWSICAVSTWSMEGSASSRSITLNHVRAALESKGGKKGNEVHEAIDALFHREPTAQEIKNILYYLEEYHYVKCLYNPDLKVFTGVEEEFEESLHETVTKINKAIDQGMEMQGEDKEPIKKINLNFDYIGEKAEKLDPSFSLENVKKLLSTKIDQILAEEEKYPHQAVLYHSAQTWNAFLIEIVTRVLTKCHLSEDKGCHQKVFRFSKELEHYKNIEEFRNSIFKGLESINPDPEVCNEECKLAREIQTNKLKKIHMENDQESDLFKETIIAASPTLFQGYTVQNESAIGFWINGFAPYEERMKAFMHDHFLRFFNKFLDEQGVPKGELLSHIRNEAVTAYKDLFPLPNKGQDTRVGGVLYQFFIDPEIIDEMAYISAPFGYKVKKKIGGSFSEDAKDVLMNLKDHTSEFLNLNKNSKYTDPKTLRPLCGGEGEGSDLLCTQVRMFPKPEWMHKVKVEMYFLDEPTQEWRKKFIEAAENIATLILKAQQTHESHHLEGEAKWELKIAQAIMPYLSEPYPEWKKVVNTLDQRLKDHPPSGSLDALQQQDRSGETPLKKLKEKADTSNHRAHREIDGRMHVVYRPNHGLAHGLRQAYLASDIIDILSQEERSFKMPEINEMVKWVKEKLKKDKYFKEKVKLLASFQRTGRLTDTGDEIHDAIKRSYAKGDQNNFIETAEKHFHDLFLDNHEIESYSKALIMFPFALTQHGETTPDEKYLGRIIKASHYCDLIRQSSYDRSLIRNNLMKYLFDVDDTVRYEQGKPGKIEEEIADILLSWSERYLEATGETYINSSKNTYEDKFFILSNDPAALVRTLDEERTSHSHELARE